MLHIKSSHPNFEDIVNVNRLKIGTSLLADYVRNFLPTKIHVHVHVD